MTNQHYALFDTKIGTCAIAWGERGINGVQLPMGNPDKTRIRMRQRYYGDIAEAEPRLDGELDGHGVAQCAKDRINALRFAEQTAAGTFFVNDGRGAAEIQINSGDREMLQFFRDAD